MINLHIILPLRERVGKRSSGAIALVVKELYERSAMREQTKIWAGPQNENEHILPLLIVPKKFISFVSHNSSYAKYISKCINDSPSTYIEIHNRAKILPILKKTLVHSRFSLYLHNNPFEIKGLETAAKREKVLELVDNIICVSHFIREKFVEGVSKNKEKCIVIHNALDLSLYSPPVPAKNTIVFVGRMIKEKGALELAQALIDILQKYQEWNAIFIGGKNSIDKFSLFSYEKKIRNVLKPIENKIMWPGILSNDRVQSFFKSSKIAVVPSIWDDPHPRVVIEAMANGCAVVTSGRGGISETIENCGVIVDPENPKDIRSGIEVLVKDPALLEIKRKQGYERALEFFDISDKIRKLDELRNKVTQNIDFNS